MEMNDILINHHPIFILILLSLLTKIFWKTKHEWKLGIVYMLWSCFVIYMLCFKNNLYD